jgi:hypothetical protein
MRNREMGKLKVGCEGLVHDLGKILSIFGEEQWTVVGDTFPVGAAFSDKIIFSEFFADNPDKANPSYNTKYGIYEPNCGLFNVQMRCVLSCLTVLCACLNCRLCG